MKTSRKKQLPLWKPMTYLLLRRSDEVGKRVKATNHFESMILSEFQTEEEKLCPEQPFKGLTKKGVGALHAFWV